MIIVCYQLEASYSQSSWTESEFHFMKWNMTITEVKGTKTNRVSPPGFPVQFAQYEVLHLLLRDHVVRSFRLNNKPPLAHKTSEVPCARNIKTHGLFSSPAR